MGKVYLAHDPKLKRDVAIKVLTDTLAAGRDKKEMRERFRLEVRAVAALKHPNIVELYDFSGEDAQYLYYVMEYIPGASLFDITSKHGLMSEVTALCVGHELALALTHAHQQQVVHRDLKPENILLHDGRLVLTDFGIVKAVAAGNALGVAAVSARTRVLGTPGFMAPEQFSGKDIDARTDIFALGAVLYNLTTGHLPYEGGSIEHIYNNLKSGACVDPRELRESLSPTFCNMLARCIAPRPKDRFASVVALREKIVEALAWHGISEVRQELQAYQTSPRADETSRRAGRIDHMVDALRQALKGEDNTAARQILGQLDGLGGPVVAPPPLKRAAAPRRRVWFALGLCLGAAVGAGGMAAYYFADVLLPPDWTAIAPP